MASSLMFLGRGYIFSWVLEHVAIFTGTLYVYSTVYIYSGYLQKTYIHCILVGGLEHFLFFHLLAMSSSPLTKSYFSEGLVSTTNQQPDSVYIVPAPLKPLVAVFQGIAIHLHEHSRPGIGRHVRRIGEFHGGETPGVTGLEFLFDILEIPCKRACFLDVLGIYDR